MSGDLTFVTGATGFVGSHVVRQLIRRGNRVRVLARNSSLKANIAGLDCEVVIGDLRDEGSLERCVQGCRRVYHVAADYRLWSRNPQEIYENNVAGTRNLLSACCEAGVERVIYTSTVGTIAPAVGDEPTDEDSPVSLDDMIGHYKRSKFMAEQLTREYAEAGLPLVIVNPTTPVGPGDVKPTPTGKIILDFIQGRMPAFIDTGLNFAGVEDVAEGHLLAAEKGRQGERYILGGENRSLEELFAMLAAICGTPAPRLRIPWVAAYVAAFVDQTVEGLLLGREPAIPIEGVRMARHKMYVSSQKARRELGYDPKPLERALREAVAYYRGEWRPASEGERVSGLRPGAV
jgi:dihydroflavonol-4-reductase